MGFASDFAASKTILPLHFQPGWAFLKANATKDHANVDALSYPLGGISQGAPYLDG